MTIEEVKEHFKDAKTVRCLSDGKLFEIHNASSIRKNDANNIWCDDINNFSVKIYNERTNRLAEIVEYKETKSTTKPTHYQTDSIDVIDFCSAYGLNFNRGNIIKYVARAGKKDNELKDLEKALDYINREIQTIKNK